VGGKKLYQKKRKPDQQKRTEGYEFIKEGVVFNELKPYNVKKGGVKRTFYGRGVPVPDSQREKKKGGRGKEKGLHEKKEGVIRPFLGKNQRKLGLVKKAGAKKKDENRHA